MIELTAEQRKALEGPGPAEARDPVTNETYVLVRKEAYQRVRSLLDEEWAEGLAQITGTTRRALEATQVLVEVGTPEGQQTGLLFDSGGVESLRKRVTGATLSCNP